MGKLIGSMSLFALAGFMLVGFFQSGIGFTATGLAALLIAVGLPAAGGAYLLYSHYRQKQQLKGSKKRLKMQTLEAEIIKLSGQKGGKLTVVEVVSALAVDNQIAKEALESLSVQGLAEPEVTERGMIVYSFYDVQNLPDKSTAKGVLDD
ncbi:MAG: hypothetical protein D6675_13760 [Gemmatimonadetes bacterium]|nr:MAG: hypothetical protein D6675_13760 [Gemmatimonadota bacterium]